MNGVRGTVYVVARIGRDGRVEDAVAEQVNLKVVDSDAGMTQWRNSLAKSAALGARKWTFKPPTQGDEVGRPFWLVRVPVDSVLHDEEPVPYGQWEAYIPGPRQSTPWMGAMDASSRAPMRWRAAGCTPSAPGPKLLTPLDGDLRYQARCGMRHFIGVRWALILAAPWLCLNPAIAYATQAQLPILLHAEVALDVDPEGRVAAVEISRGKVPAALDPSG